MTHNQSLQCKSFSINTCRVAAKCSHLLFSWSPAPLLQNAHPSICLLSLMRCLPDLNDVVPICISHGSLNEGVAFSSYQSILTTCRGMQKIKEFGSQNNAHIYLDCGDGMEWVSQSCS